MPLDKVALDRYLTASPDTKYQDWYERVFDGIPEDEISGNEYDQYEAFFDEGMDKMASQYWQTKDGFPPLQFTRDVVIRRFRTLKENPHLKTWDEVQKLINKRGY